MSKDDSGAVGVSGTVSNEKDVDGSVRNLRKLVLEDCKLKDFPSNNEYLLRFLHCTDFNVDKAFKRMKGLCELLLKHPDWFAKCGSLDKKSQLEKYDKVILRERDRSGRNIMVVKLEKVDVINSSGPEQGELSELWMELILDDPKTQSKGMSLILDMSGYSLRFFRWLTPSNIKTSAKKLELYPIKELVVHVVNTSLLLSASIKLIWPFFNEKLKNMFKFHFDDWSSLHEHISPEVLPSEYGGTGPDIDFEKLTQPLFDQNSEIYEKLKHYNTVLQQ